MLMLPPASMNIKYRTDGDELPDKHVDVGIELKLRAKLVRFSIGPHLSTGKDDADKNFVAPF
eukprot:9295608-Pyramimonas_sp.AAC.1